MLKIILIVICLVLSGCAHNISLEKRVSFDGEKLANYVILLGGGE